MSALINPNITTADRSVMTLLMAAVRVDVALSDLDLGHFHFT